MPIIRFIVDRPWLWLALALALSFATSSGFFELHVNNSMEVWLVEGDPTLASYERLREEFENDEYIVVAYRLENRESVLGETGLALAGRLTEKLGTVDHVLKVTSLANVEEIRADGDVLDVGEMVRPPLTDSERQRILAKLTTDPLYRGSLISEDATVGAIALTIAHLPQHEHLELRRALVAELKAVVEQEEGEFHLAGQPIFDIELYNVMYRDQMLLIPVMGVVFMIVLGILFRSWVGIALPTITVLMAVFWTFGLIGWSGTPLSMISGILPVVLLAIGVADSVHLLSEYQEELAALRPKREAILNAVRTVFAPCLFTSLTTSLGFLGLLIVKVRPIRDFGTFASAGTMLAFLATFTIVPAVLAILPTPKSRLVSLTHSGELSDRALGRVFGLVVRHRYFFLAASCVFLAIGFAGLPNVITNANAYRYFRSTNPTVLATDFVEEHIGGVYTMDVLLEPKSGKTSESLKEIAVLEEASQLQDKLGSQPHVEQTISPVDFVSTMNRSMNGGDEAAFRLPDTRNAVGQLLLMYEMDAPDGEFYDYVNFDQTLGRMTMRSRMSEMGSRADLVAEARRVASELEHVTATPTGMMVLYADVEHHTLVGMLRGFAIAFLAVGAMMILLLRSPRHGLLAMIPGGLPIVFVVGMTGWLAIELGTLPAMMGNVALGIAVDNAIHLLTRYRKLRASGLDPTKAIGTAVTVVGRPIMFTTTVLCIGFLVLVFSEMTQNIKFGALTSAILVGSLIGSVITLPATVLIVDERFGSRARDKEPPAHSD